MKYKAIFIDFYGTCVAEDDEIIERIVAQIGDASGADVSEILRSWRFSKLCEVSHGENFITQQQIEIITLQEVLDKFGVNTDVDEISEELFTYWGNPTVYADTLEFLNKQSKPIYIVSNIDNKFINKALRQIDFSFEHIITSEDVKSYKPRPEIYQRALSLIDGTADDVIHIGDSFGMDMVGAANCGIDCIWIDRKSRDLKHPKMVQKVATLSEIDWAAQWKTPGESGCAQFIQANS